jgi:hypothetical protein
VVFQRNKNLLSRLTPLRLILITPSFTVFIFGIGFYFGTEKVNADAIRAEIKYNKLVDSLKANTTHLLNLKKIKKADHCDLP